MATTFGFNTDESNDFGFDLPSESLAEVTERVLAGQAERAAAEQASEAFYAVDDFWGNAFDADEITAALKADLPPEGEYTGSGLVLERRKNRFEGHDEISLYGTVTNAEGRTAKSRFTIEPKKRLKENGKVAWPYQMYKQCLTAFIYVNGRNPQNGEEFEAFLANAPLKHRIVHAQNGKGVNTMGITGIKD